MAFYIFAVFLSIFGVVLFRYIDGSQCDNPFDKLYKNRAIDVEQLLKGVLGSSSWSDKMFSADNFKTAVEDCKMSTSCRVDLIFQYKNEMELCILSNQRECFSLKCTCKKGQNNGNSQLNPSYGDFKCTPKKKVMSNACDKEEEQNNNTTDDTVKDNHEQNHTTAIKSNKQNNNCNNTKENETFDNIHRTTTGSNLRKKNRFKVYPVTIVAFILGTIVGWAVSIITIHLCRSRKLRQIQNHQQADLCEDTPLHRKFSGETSEYSEITEYSRNKLGAGFRNGEYLESLSKKNTVSRATIPLENLYEKDESNQYHEVTLERSNTNHNIYNHLQPNNGTNPQVSIKKDERCVDPLYHTLALAEIENKIDVNSDENPGEAAPNLLNDNSPSNSDAKTKHIQKDEISSGRPYSMCKNTVQLTEKVDTDEESEEVNKQSNIENTYFVLQKKE